MGVATHKPTELHTPTEKSPCKTQCLDWLLTMDATFRQHKITHYYNTILYTFTYRNHKVTMLHTLTTNLGVH